MKTTHISHLGIYHTATIMLTNTITRLLHIFPKSRFILLAFLLMLLSMQSGLAWQGAPVSFTVEIAPGLLQAGDKVGVRGSAEELGEWQQTLVWLTPVAERQWNGRVQIRAIGTHDVILYKYVIESAQGIVRWESGANRVVATGKAGNPSPKVDVFDHLPEQVILTAPMTVNVSVNLLQFYIPTQQIDELRVMADIPGVGFMAEHGEGLVLKESAEEVGLWQARLIIPAGGRRDFAFKLFMVSEGQSFWETIPGHANHVALLQTGESEALVYLNYQAEAGRFEVAEEQTKGVVVDAFEPLKAIYGAEYPQTEHAYMEVLHTFAGGAQEQAWQHYGEWKAANPGGREIDDMVMLYADYVATSASVEQAQLFLHEQVALEANSYRKAQLSYHEGELLQRHGKNEQAKQLYKHVLQTHTPKLDPEILRHANNSQERRRLAQEQRQTPLQPILDYAKMGLAWTYLTDSEPDSVRLGQAWIKSLAGSPHEATRRNALGQYIRLMSQEGETGLVRQAYGRLTREGTRAQQRQARYQWLEYELRSGATDQAAAQWDTLGVELSLGLTPLANTEISTGELSTERTSIQLRSAKQSTKAEQRLTNRLLFYRAEILLSQDWPDQAELAEAMVDPSWLSPTQRYQQHKLRADIAKSKARQQAQQQSGR